MPGKFRVPVHNCDFFKTQINFSNNTFFLTSDSTKYNLGFYGFGLSTHVEVCNNCKDHKKPTRTES